MQFICQFGVPGIFFPLAINTAKKRNQKLKVLKIKVLFEIFNSHNKKICQISIHGSIRVVKKKNRIFFKKFTFIFFLYPDLAKYFSRWLIFWVHYKIDSTKNKIK